MSEIVTEQEEMIPLYIPAEPRRERATVAISDK